MRDTAPHLEQLDDLAGELSSLAAGDGVRLIWRAQQRLAKRSVVRQGRVEGSSATTLAGHGIQIVADDGRTALASRDDFDAGAARSLYQRTLGAAQGGARLGLHPAPAATMPIVRERRIPIPRERFEAVDLQQVAERLVDLEKRIDAAVPGLQLAVSYRCEYDSWRIAREDGTDVLFAMPRTMLAMRATGSGDAGRHGVSASLFGASPESLHDEAWVETFFQRALSAATLATQLPDAPDHPAGSFPLVIDYALAKGLAHEAFGHASETDGFRSSILAEKGRFRRGETVGPESLSIVDEPLENDHAWQPFSANGVPREPVRIVDQGRLLDALSDPWSAESAGVDARGCARAESYRHAPQPRMTNIRIESSEALPAEGSFESYGPDEVRGLLADAGVFKRHPKVAFLSGYTGGQVNTTGGDFVFHCKAIYDLDERGSTLHKPAIFSGSMFGALQSIREAFGPLLLDAIGFCGKWGQSVPSSGGSHYFLVLEPHDSVRLGGRR